jgi:hypothetical protein
MEIDLSNMEVKYVDLSTTYKDLLSVAYFELDLLFLCH